MEITLPSIPGAYIALISLIGLFAILGKLFSMSLRAATKADIDRTPMGGAVGASVFIGIATILTIAGGYRVRN